MWRQACSCSGGRLAPALPGLAQAFVVGAALQLDQPAHGLFGHLRRHLGCGGQAHEQLGEVAALRSLEHVALDAAQGDAQLRGDLGVAQAVELGQQEGLLGQRRQAVEQAVQLDQGLQDDGAGLFAGDFPLGQAGQGFQVGALDVLAAVVVAQHAAGDGGEEGARFVDARGLARNQDLDEGVLGQVGGVLRAAEAAPQPAREPVVVVAVEGMQRGRVGEVGARHLDIPGAEGLTNDKVIILCLRECLPTTAGCRRLAFRRLSGRRGTAPGWRHGLRGSAG